MFFIRFNMDVFIRTAITALGIFSWMILPIYGRLDGADPSACKSLIPGHGVSAQTDPPPFVIETNETDYIPGRSIQGRLSLN